MLVALGGPWRADPLLPAWVHRLRPGDPSRRLPGALVRKLTLGGQTRNALPAVGRQVLDFPGGPAERLEVGTALRCAEGARCGGAVRFLIEAEVEGQAGRVTLLDTEQRAQWLERQPETLPLAGPPPSWLVHRLPLTRFAGLPLRLTFEARPRPASRAPGFEAPVPFWSEPLFLAPRAGLPNLLMISIDTLRADRLGCQGYRRPTSPNIDRLAAESVRFARAFSPAPWTTPAHMSLFTGLDPSHHHLTLGASAGRQRPLAPGIATLANLMRERGYHTVAITGGGTMGAALGFDRGFDDYVDGPLKLTPKARALSRARLESLRSTPFFMYVHTFEVHAPYARTSMAGDLLSPAARAQWDSYLDLEWVTRTGDRSLPPAVAGAPTRPPSQPRRARAGLVGPVAQQVAPRSTSPPPREPEDSLLRRLGLYRAEVTSALYDGGVRAADEFVGELLEGLERLGLARNTIVVLTSDHGEEFGDHGAASFWDAHCVTQYDELIHVPLILRLPGVAPRVVASQVRSIDVLPTLVEWLGLRRPSVLDGRSLVPLLRGDPLPPEPSLSEATCTGPELKALRSEAYKYVAQFPAAQRDEGRLLGLEREWLYRLSEDPAEKRDLAAIEPRLVKRLRQELLALLAQPGRQPPAAPAQPHDPATLERLKALGYVQ